MIYIFREFASPSRNSRKPFPPLTAHLNWGARSRAPLAAAEFTQGSVFRGARAFGERGRAEEQPGRLRSLETQRHGSGLELF